MKKYFFNSIKKLYFVKSSNLITKSSFSKNKTVSVQFIDDVNKTGEIMAHPKKIVYFLNRINTKDEESLKYSIYNNTSFIKYGVYYNNTDSDELNILDQKKIVEIYEYLYKNGFENINLKISLDYIKTSKLKSNEKV